MDLAERKDWLRKLHCRDLPQEVEIDLMRRAADGYRFLLECLADPTLSKHQICNAMTLAMRMSLTTVGDINRFLPMVVALSSHTEIQVRSAAVNLIMMMVHGRVRYPKLYPEAATWEKTKPPIRAALQAGLRKNTENDARLFLETEPC